MHFYDTVSESFTVKQPKQSVITSKVFLYQTTFSLIFYKDIFSSF